MSIVIDWANRSENVRSTLGFQCEGSKDSRKLPVMLKFILQLSQVGDNALALMGLLIIAHTYNRTVKVVNGTSLESPYLISN